MFLDDFWAKCFLDLSLVDVFLLYFSNLSNTDFLDARDKSASNLYFTCQNSSYHREKGDIGL